MDLFHEIPDGAVILRSKGVFKQAKVFRRGADVFAAHGTGFIRLLSSGGTTLPTTHWLDISADGVTTPRGRGPAWNG